MAARFVDANVFLRYLTGDDEEQAARCLGLFRRVEAGDELVTTSESVLTEVVWVLTSPNLYRADRLGVAQRLSSLLGLRGMQLPSRRLFLRALDLFATYPRLDFPDALSVAHTERGGLPAIVSFDRDFDGVPGVVREEP